MRIFNNMRTFSNAPSIQKNPYLALTSFKLTKMYRRTHVTQVRVQIRIPSRYQQEPIISRLIVEQGLVVNITGAALGENTGSEGLFDLELRGTPKQIRQGLLYLRALEIKLVGKPNAEGDSWHY
jgi:hypothetical protein